MPLKTNTNIYPYFDDYDPSKDFYKVLFKPRCSVQMRELNQLQTIIQTQIERFGDNIFTTGTIVAGCNFQFYNPYPYIKLPDSQSDGSVVVPSNYLGKFVVDNVSNLKGYVVNWQDGYELSTPDLKTLYVNYINSGNDGNTSAFVPGNNVTIYDGSYPVNSVEVVNGGAGMANTDQLVINPAMLINVATGTFTSSDYLVNPLTGANVAIVTANTTVIPGKTLVTVKPLDTDLTNSSVNSTAWSFALYDNVTNDGATAIGVIEQVYGSGAQGKVVTSSTGTLTRVDLVAGGKGYEYSPTATVKTANASVVISNLVLTPKNFVAKLRIPSDADAVGNGYAFGITEGITYQQGYFLRVSPQTIIVSKYSSSPNNVVVGFSTTEAIITAQQDSTLYDNALGEPNEFAPGADRLKLSPDLVLQTKEQAAVNTDFFTLVEWNNGFPYKQNKLTNYSRIGDAMGDLVYDSSGNFVLDAFQVTTETVANTSKEGTHFTTVIDPGQGYINGRKVQTISNYKIDLSKGLDTSVSNNIVSINYGNYVRVNNLVGNFDISTGSTVALYDKPASYLSNTTTITTGTITPQGSQIGTAKIRSMTLESGYPGTPGAVYRLYLFDIAMSSGQNFQKVQSVYYNDTYDGLADVILVFDGTTSANVAQLNDTALNTLLFPSGVESLKNSNTTTYTYRTSDVANIQISTATITITLVDADEYYPYGGELAVSQAQELTVVPVEATVQCVNATGSVGVNTTSTIVTGAATDFSSYYAVGDYLEVDDGGANVATRRITGVTNTTSLVVDSPFPFTDTGFDHHRVFPVNVPIPLGQRQGLTANVDGTEKILTIQLAHSNGTAMTFDYGEAELDTSVAYNVERRNVSSASKTAVRNKYVKFYMANNENGASGPWCLGVPDAFRLRAVYVGNSTVNAASSEVTNDFYVDNNQTSNYMGLSYLYKKPQARTVINKTDYILCCFDYFTRDNAGYYDTVSYLRTSTAANVAAIDSMTFDELRQSSSASSWEVPEVYTYDGKYYDLLNTFDFRPTAANTANPGSTPATAPLNPSETFTLSAHSKFPKPTAVMKTQVEQYLGRIDDVYISENGSIFALKGIPDVNPRNRYQSNHPKDCLRLQTLLVPPYPNICKTVKNSLMAIIKTNMGNEKILSQRKTKHLVNALLSSQNAQTSQPMVYTMEDIANLERRIKDLEYYVSLSLLETNITNKVIPSSIDPLLNRFKFGFFADDFSTETYSDTNNPQYAASLETEGDPVFTFTSDKNPLATGGGNTGTSIVNPSKIVVSATNRCVPPKWIWSLRHFTENVFYVDESVISQNCATKHVANCVVDVDTNDESVVGDAYYTSVNRRQSTVWLEDLPGLVTIYFDIIPKTGGNFGSTISVYNASGTLIASTDTTNNSSKLLTTADKTFLSTNDRAKEFYEAIAVSDFATDFTRVSDNQDFGYGTGKIQLTTQGGGQIVIVVDSYDITPNYKLLVSYPSIFSADSNITNVPECDPNPPVFRGTLEAGALTVQQWSCSNLFRVNSTGYKAFVLEATGLKPSTIHKFYMDTEQWPECIILDQARFKAAQYDPKRKSNPGKVPGSAETLLLSSKRKVNEVNRFLQLAMKDLYDGSGNPGPATVLKTDTRGKIRFLVFFPLNVAGWFSQDFNAPSYRLDYSGSDFFHSGYGEKLKPTYGSMGYTSLVLMDESGQSQAGRVFANRTPNKTIPDDPAGNI